MAEDLTKEYAKLVESLSTYVANLACLPVGRFAEADARNILDAVRNAETNSQKRLLLPGLLTMVDIRLKEDVFYVSANLLTGENQMASRESSANGKFVRLEECFTMPASIN